MTKRTWESFPELWPVGADHPGAISGFARIDDVIQALRIHRYYKAVKDWETITFTHLASGDVYRLSLGDTARERWQADGYYPTLSRDTSILLEWYFESQGKWACRSGSTEIKDTVLFDLWRGKPVFIAQNPVVNGFDSTLKVVDGEWSRMIDNLNWPCFPRPWLENRPPKPWIPPHRSEGAGWEIEEHGFG